jgi:putative transposon-encoded protein
MRAKIVESSDEQRNMLEKAVRQSGNSGRVYLPPEWIGKHVKIIRID